MPTDPMKPIMDEYDAGIRAGMARVMAAQDKPCCSAIGCTFAADGTDGLCRVHRAEAVKALRRHLYTPYVIAAAAIALIMLAAVVVAVLPVEQLVTTHPTFDEWKGTR